MTRSVITNANEEYINVTKVEKTTKRKTTTEDHWFCIAHLSAEDMLKSKVIEEKKYFESE